MRDSSEDVRETGNRDLVVVEGHSVEQRSEAMFMRGLSVTFNRSHRYLLLSGITTSACPVLATSQRARSYVCYVHGLQWPSSPWLGRE